MKQPELGKLCSATDERDAIHLALYPGVAGEKLTPGQRVGISRVTGRVLSCGTIIGVVDPFLPVGTVVEPGQRVWVCMLPGTVTGLRHVYTHPSLDGNEAKHG